MKPLLSLAVLFLPSFAFAEVSKFEMQEVAKDLSIGYAVLTADLNGDKKPDILVVDKHRVIWYENPTWKMHTILTGTTKPDNVTAAALDIDGDGKLDLVLGADWAPFNTKSGGTLQWLRQPKNIDEEWEMFPICEEPTVHRVKAVPDFYGKGKPGIILAPLMGRDSTKAANWMDGRPVRILAFPIPADPVKGPWKPEVVSEELHVVHNLEVNKSLVHKLSKQAVQLEPCIDCVSYDGIFRIARNEKDVWTKIKIGEGNQDDKKSNRGGSEIAVHDILMVDKTIKSDFPFVATIEPWHGNQVVVYAVSGKATPDFQRTVLDDTLRWGHAIKVASLSQDGSYQIVVGVRDNPSIGDTFTEKCGVRIYEAEDATGTKWKRTIIDNGGMACEDLAVEDLNGDGKPDIIAVGRATKNLRIYWNGGKK